MLLAGALVGCASAGARPAKPTAEVAKRPAPAAARPALRPAAPVREVADGHPLSGAPNPAEVPDAVPVPVRVPADGPNRPYQVFGRNYVPLTEDLPVVERGVASWYGRKFHGRRTASGETYDMHAMTAAHPTLPLPSFALVRNPANGREVVVRVNDRGPFHPGRIIDLSHVAAMKLGVSGLSQVEVRRLTNDEIRTGAWRRDLAPGERGGAEDRRLALRRTESQLAAAEADGEGETGSPVAFVAWSAGTSAASAPAEAALPLPVAAPAVTVAADSHPARAEHPRAAPDTDRPLAPEVLVASLPPSAGPVVEPPRAAVAVQAPASASGMALPVGMAGYWVQLGAFRVRDGAESFRRRLVNELGWIAPVLTVLSEADLHRLQAGPYPSRDHAHGVAQRLREALSLVPVIVERR